jgi:hypothetical protein
MVTFEIVLMEAPSCNAAEFNKTKARIFEENYNQELITILFCYELQ